jgi:hypothetical protein
MLPEGNYTPAATCFQAVLTGRLLYIDLLLISQTQERFALSTNHRQAQLAVCGQPLGRGRQRRRSALERVKVSQCQIIPGPKCIDFLQSDPRQCASSICQDADGSSI